MYKEEGEVEIGVCPFCKKEKELAIKTGGEEEAAWCEDCFEKGKYLCWSCLKPIRGASKEVYVDEFGDGYTFHGEWLAEEQLVCRSCYKDFKEGEDNRRL